MVNKFFPHRWFSWRVLVFIVQAVFYIAFAVGIDALWQLGATFIHPPAQPATARHLYIAAFLQAGLICLATATLIHMLRTFAVLSGSSRRLTPKK